MTDEAPAPDNITPLPLNDKEHAVFSVYAQHEGPLTINEVADTLYKTFPDAEFAKRQSWVRNAHRKLITLGLVRQVAPGTHQKTGRREGEIGDDIELSVPAPTSDRRKSIAIGANGTLDIEAKLLGAEIVVMIGTRGFGKTYLAMLMAEQLHTFNQTCHEVEYIPLPFVALDPQGVWWGLRVNEDGASPGLPVMILGGKKGDLPLPDTGASAGQLGARVFSSVRYPGGLILDIAADERGRPRRPSYQREFVKAFAETIYLEQEPVHIFIDEAQEFLPQEASGEEAKMIRSIADLVNRGRNKGLGITLISQRFANINKKAISQPNHLFVLRQAGDTDSRTAKRWLGANIDTLNMQPGDAYYRGTTTISPARLRIARRMTFSSSDTPSLAIVERSRQKTAREHIVSMPEEVVERFRQAIENPTRE